MMLRIFTIYDDKTKAYTQPFFMQTAEAAIRAVKELVNDPTHQFGKHAGDYTLFSCGVWDDQTGRASWDNALSNVAHLWELRDQQKPQPGLFDMNRQHEINHGQSPAKNGSVGGDLTKHE